MICLIQIDILNPLISLEWKECREPPVPRYVGDAQAVWLKDKVYVGGQRDASRLYIYTPATDTWTTLDTPVYDFALTTYHSQLLLVGGWNRFEQPLANKLWTLSEDGQWQESLPPIPTLFIHVSAMSHGDHLLVIGGNDYNNRVYVYNGHHWASAQHLSPRLDFIVPTVFNGHLYLMGRENYLSQQMYVYSASLDSLLASCQPSETSQPSSLWKRLTDPPSGRCYPAVFGNRLVAVVGGGSTTSLHAYSSLTQSWEHIGDAPVSSNLIFFCAVVLPSNELMIVGKPRAFKVTLKSKSVIKLMLAITYYMTYLPTHTHKG